MAAHDVVADDERESPPSREAARDAVWRVLHEPEPDDPLGGGLFEQLRDIVRRAEDQHQIDLTRNIREGTVPHRHEIVSNPANIAEGRLRTLVGRRAHDRNRSRALEQKLGARLGAGEVPHAVATCIDDAAGYLGGMIEAAGKPGCTVIMAAAVRDAWDRVHHHSYPDVWERVLPVTRDPYEISARFEDEFARHAEHIDAYRHRFAFHPIHGILATHPLKRLRHVGRVIVAGARDPHVPRHLGFEVAASVEDAIARAQTIHGRGATIGVVEQLAMPADPDRATR